jgi:hypothetical protein
VKHKVIPFNFDFFGYWKHCVNHLKIQPSEAWNMDFVEIKCIAEMQGNDKQDLSLMLNFERKRNGATNEFLGIKTGGNNGD